VIATMWPLFFGANSTIERTAVAIVAVAIAVIVTVGLGAFGIRRAHSASDFFVASRSVPPGRNATAICGEYLSAASFLGVAGLVMRYGVDMLWYPIGYTVGYLLLLFFVASPLRRFGAYTIADFAEGRFGSSLVRRLASVLVILVSVTYMVPQLRGAGVTLGVLTGAPYAVGVVLVAAVVTLNVSMGGMRGITFVQAFQFWLKWVAISFPAVVIGVHFALHRRHFGAASGDVARWATPIRSGGLFSGKPGYAITSIVIAQVIGTLGLPHILVRFHTNPDGRAARRTTVIVVSLLGLFYVFPGVIGAMGRLYAPELLANQTTDTVVLRLPQAVFGTGWLGDALTALVACGAFAAFLSTASGLMISAAGAISQDLLGGETRDFRIGAAAVGLVILTLGLRVQRTDINQLVTWVFGIAGSSISPFIVLSIWWRRLSKWGAVSGLLVGAVSATAAVVLTFFGPVLTGWPKAMLSQPAAWTIPLGFATMVVVSILTPASRPREVGAMMLTMHAPEELGLARAFRV
jgi:cation/acetate symporter